LSISSSEGQLAAPSSFFINSPEIRGHKARNLLTASEPTLLLVGSAPTVIVSSQPIDSTSVADHYDELDAFYREIWGEHLHHGFWSGGNESSELAVTQLVRLVAERGQVTRGTRVCDVGCGYGATARLLARQNEAVVTAFTVSPVQYAYAREVDSTGNPQYLLADWLAAELPSEIFDATIAIESAEHMPDKVEFFHRVLRVLKPGGRLVVCSWLAGEKTPPWQEKWLLQPICTEGRLPHLLTSAELVAMAEKSGLAAHSQENISAQVAPTWSIVIRRFIKRLLSDRRYRSFILDSAKRNRVFAKTIVRIWLAYQTGAMQYGIFTFEKPPRSA
jgi:tocopherol O-methyltransferase